MMMHLFFYIVKVIEHHEDIHQVPDKNYIASDIIDLIQKDHDYYDLLEKTESIMKRLIKMKHEKNQDLQNTFSPYGIDLEQFFTRVFQEIDYVEHQASFLKKIYQLLKELQNEYAVIRITESRIDILSGIPEVEYVEKPKRLFFQAAEGRRVSCINAVQDTRLSLYGQGILVAIIDSGIDYANIDFRNADGSTRIRYLWDQSLNPADGETAPVGYSIGVEYTKGQIDEALNAQTVSEQRRLVRSQDISGHGTAVAE